MLGHASKPRSAKVGSRAARVQARIEARLFSHHQYFCLLRQAQLPLVSFSKAKSEHQGVAPDRQPVASPHVKLAMRAGFLGLSIARLVVIVGDVS